MKSNERRKKIHDQAYSRMLEKLAEDAEYEEKLDQSTQNMVHAKDLEEEAKRIQHEELQKEHNRLLEEQLAEQRHVRDEWKAQRKATWIDPDFHGYPDRPETPPDIRRENERIQQQHFKDQLDGHMKLRRNLLGDEAQREQDETSALVQRYKQDLIDDQNEKKRRREYEKQVYREGLEAVKQARQFMQTMKDDSMARTPHIDEPSPKQPKADIASQQTIVPAKLYASPRQSQRHDEPPLPHRKQTESQPPPQYQHPKAKSEVRPIRAVAEGPPPSEGNYLSSTSKFMPLRERMDSLSAQPSPSKMMLKSKSQRALESQVFPINRQRTPPEVKKRRSARARLAIQNQIARLRDRDNVVPSNLSPIKAQLDQKRSRRALPTTNASGPLNEKQQQYLVQRSEQLRRSIEDQMSELEEIESIAKQSPASGQDRLKLPDIRRGTHNEPSDLSLSKNHSVPSLGVSRSPHLIQRPFRP